MKVEKFGKYKRIMLDGNEYALVGIGEPGKFTLGVKIGEQCNYAGFYQANWLAVDGTTITCVAEASDYRIYFNPETEAVEVVQA